MKNNGFTLVELMIIVVIIGILAAVSMPQLQRAADKARAAEAPQTLIAVAGAQEAFRIRNGEYLNLDNGSNRPNWERLGLRVPDMGRFIYTVVTTQPGDFNPQDPYAPRNPPPAFIAKAELNRPMFSVKQGVVTINESGVRTATPELRLLISSFGATQ